MSCKCVQLRVPSTQSPQLPTLLFLSLSLGSALSLKARLQLPCCAPTLPRTPPHAPRGRYSSLTVAAFRLLGWHGWTHTPEQRPLLSEPATRRAVSSQPPQLPVFWTNLRPKKNARFAFAGKHRHLAILRAARPDPAPGGARLGAENQPETWWAFTWTSEAGFCAQVGV